MRRLMLADFRLPDDYTMKSLGTLVIDFSYEKHEIHGDHVIDGGNYTQGRPF